MHQAGTYTTGLFSAFNVNVSNSLQTNSDTSNCSPTLPITTFTIPIEPTSKSVDANYRNHNTAICHLQQKRCKVNTFPVDDYLNRLDLAGGHLARFTLKIVKLAQSKVQQKLLSNF